MTQGFEELSAAFLDEFRKTPNSQFHKDIRIVDLRSKGRGRGIIATTDIPAETELFSIPREFVISVENSRLYKQLPRLFESSDVNDEEGSVETNSQEHTKDSGGDGDHGEADDGGSALSKPWLDLILVLIHDYLHRETSEWKAYWDVLPECFDTLMFWSEAELAELQASSVRSHIGKASADKMFTSHVIPIIHKHVDVFFPRKSLADEQPLSEDDLLELCHRMGSLIMAYAFDLQTTDDNEDDDDEKVAAEAEDGWVEDKQVQTAMGMVPMADMLNADAEFNAHLEHGEDRLSMRSLRTIKKDEEVLNYYGPLGNGDLARRYGYTSELHSRHDVVEISWDLIGQVIREHFGKTSQQMEKLLDETDGIDIEETFVLERETGDPDETGVHTTTAKFTTFPEELVDQVTTISTAIGPRPRLNEDKKRGIDDDRRLKQEQERKQKLTFLQIMVKVISARSAQFPTTLEEDERILNHIKFDTNVDADTEMDMDVDMDVDTDTNTNPDQNSKLRITNRRTQMATTIRAGEKRLLQEVGDLTRQLLTKYDDDANNKGSGSGQSNNKSNPNGEDKSRKRRKLAGR